MRAWAASRTGSRPPPRLAQPLEPAPRRFLQLAVPLVVPLVCRHRAADSATARSPGLEAATAPPLAEGHGACFGMAPRELPPYAVGMRAPRDVRRWQLQEADHRLLAEASLTLFSRERDVLAAYLYGSAARGEPAVDLDIAVMFGGEIDVRRLEALATELAARGAPRGPEVDLRSLNAAAPRFQVAVLKDGRLLYERDREARLEREAMIMSCWADFKPTWDSVRGAVLGRWAHG